MFYIQSKFHLCLGAYSLTLLSSKAVRYIPYPLGKEIQAFFPLPITKTLPILVAKCFSLVSLICTTSTDPGCFSMLVIIPTLPTLFPPVMYTMFPNSAFTKSSTFPVVKLNFKVSLI
jgi:hypothetical protein